VELLDLASGAVRQLAGHSSDPSFSADGRWIALTSTRDRDGTHRIGEDATAYAGELYLVDHSGKRWRRLTFTPRIDEESPSFSPDGKRIAYVRIDEISTPRVSDSYHHTIYEINTNGTCPTRLRDDLTDTFEYYAATWRPGPSILDNGRLRC
jgi:Tol biopolymer transport system component